MSHAPFVRSRWLRVALSFFASLALFFAGWSAPANAEEEAQTGTRPHVRILRPSKGSQLLDECVTLTIGELSAVGLDVEVLHAARLDADVRLAPLGSGNHGLLSLWQDEHWVQIDAWGPDGGTASSARLDTRRPEITPTVVSVRALETLRAKWLEYRELGGADLPEAAIEFARANRQPEEREPEPARPEPRRQAEERDESAERPERERVDASLDERPTEPRERVPSRLEVLLHAGPSLSTDARLAADLSVLVGRGWLSAGARVNGALSPTQIEHEAGTASIGYVRLLGMLRATLDLPGDSQGYAQLGWGVTSYSIDATANRDFEARDGSRTEFTTVFGAGAHAWLSHTLGLYAEAEAFVLANSVAVRMDGRAVHTEPALGGAVGAGVALRLP